MNAQAVGDSHAHRIKIVRNIIDEENRPSRPGRKRRHGRTLKARIGDNGIGHARAFQIGDAHGLGLGRHIGEHHDLGLIGEQGQGRRRALHGLQIMARAGIEGLEQVRHGIIVDRGPAFGIFDIAVQPEAVELEATTLIFEESLKTSEELEEDFVAVANDKGAVGLKGKGVDLSGDDLVQIGSVGGGLVQGGSP